MHFGFEALIRNTLNDHSILDGLNDASFYDYLKPLKEIAQSGSKIELNFRFESKELIPLQSFVTIFDCFSRKNIHSKDNLKFYLESLNKESALIRSKDEKGLIKLLHAEYETLNKQLGDLNYFHQAYIYLLIGKYKQLCSNEYRAEIMKIVLSSSRLITNSTPLMNYYFKPFKIQPSLPEKGEDEDMNSLFMSFRDSNNSSLLLINNDGNPVLKECLFFYFQKVFNVFFNEQTNNEDKVIGIPLQYFDIAMKYIANASGSDERLKNLALSYALSYVKVYLYYYVAISYHQSLSNEQLSGIDKLITNQPSPFSKVVKIYILKLLMKYMTYYELYEINWIQKCNMTWIKEFIGENKTISLIQYSFISNVKDRNAKEKDKDKDANNVLSFFDSTFNETILSHKAIINNASISQIFAILDLKISDSIKKFLFLIYDLTTYKSVFLPKIDEKQIEMWLYCYRLCLVCLNAPGSWYHDIFNEEFMSNLNKAFVPGAEIKETVRVTSAISVEHILKENYNEAIYICSCGLHYLIGNCGNPNDVSICGNCDQEIGGIHHSMVKREGHLRIFPNVNIQNQKLSVYANYEKYTWGQDYEKICEDPKTKKKYSYHKASILLNEFKQKTIADINNEASTGIISVTYSFFGNRSKWMREMDQVTYRLLSLILYSLFHFGNMLKYFTDDQLKAILGQGKTCADYIEANWKILAEELSKKGMHLCIFLNMIFSNLANEVSKHKTFNTKEERNSFEIAINNIIKTTESEYNKFATEYKAENSKLLQYNINSIISFVNEIEKPTAYPILDYPYYAYFMIDNCQPVSKINQDMINYPELKTSFPILSNYLTQGANIRILSSLEKINPFANYMLNQYSYTITRDQSQQETFKHILKDANNKSIEAMYNNFEEGWNAINIEKRQYNCFSLPNQSISKTDSIAYALNDDGVDAYGMHLASFYQYFIQYQNDFLKNVADGDNRHCSYFKEAVSQKIMVQDATENEIVSLAINSTNSPFDSFEELVNCFALKDCFDENWNINYSNYTSMTIDYDMIEEALGVAILPGKRLFATSQRFMNYGYEGCRAEKSSLITDYLKKYPQEELTREQKESLYKYSNDHSNAVKSILFSVPMLIFYINKNNYQSTDSITDIVNTLPQFINLQCKDFFMSLTSLNANQLIKVYEYYEHLCFQSILNNLGHTLVQEELSDDMQKTVNGYFSSLKEGSLLNNLNLATATRRFISRKLSGKRAQNEFKAEDQLFFFIANVEYWPESMATKDEFEEEFELLKKRFEAIHNCHAVSFYHCLGGDDSLLNTT